MTYLFLDDVRDPSSVGNYMFPVDLRVMYRKENWQIVRNYKEFTEWITENGLPDVISFDHDIAWMHYDPELMREHFAYLEETGYDCAKWLTAYCEEKEKPLPTWYVHSMNPVGSENIKNHLNNYGKS